MSAHDLDRIIVRLPDGMRDRISDLAKTNGRSMTAEVVAAIERHLESLDAVADLSARVKELEDHNRRLGQGGAERYWENRWRDKAAENDRLKKELDRAGS